MEAKTDAELLREYAEASSESAFAEIVQRHTNLVYSAALRQVELPDAAADVAQQVFIALAREASALVEKTAGHASIAGWLCRCTRNVALNLRRKRFRQESRERQAMEIFISESSPDWESVRPLLDEAMSELSETDQDALVLRFYKNQDLRSVGHALGVNDDTAQKRVSRAIEKLRAQLIRRGISTNSAALSLALSANAVQAAPAGLAGAISAATGAGAAAQVSVASAVTKTIAMTTLQKTVLTIALTASIGAALYQGQQISKLRNQNSVLQQQQASLAEQIQSLERERDEAKNGLPPLSHAAAQMDTARELAALRSQATNLQRQLDEAVTDWDPKSVVGRISLLKKALKKRPEAMIPEIRSLTDRDWLRIVDQSRVQDLESEDGLRRALSEVRQAAKAKLAYRLGSALSSYVADNAGQLPVDTLQLKPYLDAQHMPPDIADSLRRGAAPGQALPDLQPRNYPPVEEGMLQRYRMTQSGDANALRPGQPVMTETAAVDPEFDTQFQIGLKSYLLAGTGSNNQTGWGGAEGPDFQSMTPEQRKGYENSVRQMQEAKQRSEAARSVSVKTD